MWVRRMGSVVVIGLVLSGGALSPDHAVANEPVPVKPEPVPAKPAPVKPRSAGSDTKPVEKMRPPANGSPALKATALPHLPATITGKDGAPMVLVPAGESRWGASGR